LAVSSSNAATLNSNAAGSMLTGSGDVQALFAMNARSPVLNVIEIDRQIAPDAIPTLSTGTFVPNLYRPAVITGSNLLAIHAAEPHLHHHFAPGYTLQVRYASGATKAVVLQRVTSNSSSETVLLATRQGDLVELAGPDRLMNCVLQGVYVADAARLMAVAAARYGSNIALRYDPGTFNADLYRLLYPDAQPLTGPEAYLDYVLHDKFSGVPRIGQTADIAVTSSAMRAVLPALSVTGVLATGMLRLNAADVTGISRDYSTPWTLCSDDNLVTERAVKRFSDRVRDVRMLNGTADNITVLSNLSARQQSTTGPAVFADTVQVRSNLRCGASVQVAGEVGAALVKAMSGEFGDLTVAGTVSAAQVVCRGPLSLAQNLTVAGSVSVRSVIAADAITVSNGDIVTTRGDIVSERGAVRSARVDTVALDARFASANDLSVQVARCTDVLCSNSVTAGSMFSASLQCADATCTALHATVADFEVLNTASAIVTSLQAGTCVATNIGAEGVIASRMECGDARIRRGAAERLSCSNLVTGDATVTGRLNVTGMFTFPPQTFVATSNIRADSLIVDQQGTFDAVEARSVTAQRFGGTRFSLVKGTSRGSSRQQRVQDAACRHFADVLQNISVDNVNGCPTVTSTGGFTQQELLALCIGALRHVLQEQQQHVGG
jgi:hypothetical protein